MLHHELQTTLDNQLITLVNESPINLVDMEKVLNAGANPNLNFYRQLDNVLIKETEVSGVHPDCDINTVIIKGSTNVKYKLLHVVDDIDAVQLLLKFGANPEKNAYPADFADLVDSILTPLHLSARNGNYHKLFVLVSQWPIFKIRTLNEVLCIILENIKQNPLSDFPDAENAIDILIRKSADIVAKNYYNYKNNFPFLLAFKYRQESIINKMMYIHFQKIIPYLKTINLKHTDNQWNEKFSMIYENTLIRYNQMIDFSMGLIVFKQACNQENHPVSSLSNDILLHLLSYLCPPDFSAWNRMTSQHSREEILKSKAFKIIYNIMGAGDQSFSVHDFPDKTNSLPPADLIYAIENKINANFDGMTTEAWQLACNYFEDCSENNTILMRHLRNWYVKNNIELKLIPDISFFNSHINECKKAIDQSIRNQFDTFLDMKAPLSEVRMNHSL